MLLHWIYSSECDGDDDKMIPDGDWVFTTASRAKAMTLIAEIESKGRIAHMWVTGEHADYITGCEAGDDNREG